MMDIPRFSSRLTLATRRLIPTVGLVLVAVGIGSGGCLYTSDDGGGATVVPAECDPKCGPAETCDDGTCRPSSEVGGDAGTDGTTGGSSNSNSQCRDLATCIQDCPDGDDACTQDCRNEYPESRDEFQNWVSCIDSNCSEGTRECQCSECRSEVSACLGDSVCSSSESGSGGTPQECTNLARCIQECPDDDDACRQECGSKYESSVDELADWSNCVNDNCPNGDQSCQCSSCETETTACFGASVCSSSSGVNCGSEALITGNDACIEIDPYSFSTDTCSSGYGGGTETEFSFTNRCNEPVHLSACWWTKNTFLGTQGKPWSCLYSTDIPPGKEIWASSCHNQEGNSEGISMWFIGKRAERDPACVQRCPQTAPSPYSENCTMSAFETWPSSGSD